MRYTRELLLELRTMLQAELLIGGRENVDTQTVIDALTIILDIDEEMTKEKVHG